MPNCRHSFVLSGFGYVHSPASSGASKETPPLPPTSFVDGSGTVVTTAAFYGMAGAATDATISAAVPASPEDLAEVVASRRRRLGNLELQIGGIGHCASWHC